MPPIRSGRLAGALVLLLALAAAAGADMRIVNGTPTSDFPATGLVQTSIGLCSGVLIGCRTFLTAAHCFCETTDGASCQGTSLTDPARTIVFLQHAGFAAVSDVNVNPGFTFTDTSTHDLAIVTLAAPITGIAPSALDATAVPPPGTRATIVGFGSTGVVNGSDVGFGLKRTGEVTTTTCSAPGLVCWSFTGVDANTCHGDSGGPLFADLGAGPVVAGITSGGAANCAPPDLSFDASVFDDLAWIQGVAGADLGTAACGGLPAVGQPGAAVQATTGSFAAPSTFTTTFGVAPRTQELRVTTNGTLTGNADLYLRAGAPATPTTYDCHGTNSSVFESCIAAAPQSGAWSALLVGVTGHGDFQLTATTFGGDPPVCGNGIQEPGEQCDGADALGCLAGCTPSCTCVACTEGALDVQDYNLVPKFLLKARLAAAGALDPRAGGLVIGVLGRDGSRITATIPGGQPGWRGRRNAWSWRGEASGLRRVTLRRRRGAWAVAVAGRGVPGAATFSATIAEFVLSVDATCGVRTLP
ncbi:MAG TPA: trypsin-like serine protease [Candidatus Binatia bacterium]|nr:trypsin-like serine protease [Candidatus Binatia bacterium]